MCGKRIHCGCVASVKLFKHLDLGGLRCICCTSRFDDHSFRPVQKAMAIVEPGQLFLSENEESNGFLGKTKQEKVLPAGDVGTCFSILNHQSVSSSFCISGNSRTNEGVNDMYDNNTNQPSLDFSLANPVDSSSPGLSFPGAVIEGREHEKNSPFQQDLQTCLILPNPPKPSPSLSFKSNKGVSSQIRAARPPAEGLGGRTYLLPRYWPRITDQELQQLSGDLKSNVEPLFEKVLSVSDAGRTGRLVLPKGCAETYFPPIDQSDGVPITVQDIKGKDWTFQFRFWPNNNSRMYVLEGISPCIQCMQLEAGDTVTFGRIVPGGKLVMGFRKAPNYFEMQSSNLLNGSGSEDTSFTGMTENLTTGGRIGDDSMHQKVPVSEKKRARNIGSKNKRLVMHADDAMELRITGEESQKLFRPPPTAQPASFVIEDCDFELYDEPPVFGKQTIFTVRPSGEQEQWAQCDSCSKWRRLPVHVLIPPKWTCLDSIWDSNSCSCSASDERSPKELEALSRVRKNVKKRKIAKNNEDYESSGLETLATAAVLEDSIGDLGVHSVGMTTKHPRHRPGCTCIVCSQPPSGKGKHQRTCKCNVCLTVKRRFKTLTLRKKKKGSERKVVIALSNDQVPLKDGPKANGVSGTELMQTGHSENDRNSSGDQTGEYGIRKELLDLDLNSPP